MNPPALPEQPPNNNRSNFPGYINIDDINICGDHLTTDSIEGAIISGKKTAEAIISDKGLEQSAS